ncbi:glycosyltransferase family 2 protein [Chitinasiproducens palmae]|uniref:Glycosyltransferase like family 2 n=1 Tax=Chitinasiproducens palmae TaxID=1770053 RepID=A0A1H2PTV8_9BURK|nr:glycosyltransferase family 2 protein [Chitinasiproducens palmae]SDV50553.1 Glycosyltransferase like family 2 [Chitinasiproducens palmae]
MKVSVIVPTHRRVTDLLRCLDALAAQRRIADETIVVTRIDDRLTHERLAQWQHQHALPGLRIVTIAEPGVVAAYNLGLDTASGDIVCFTDDDAAPHRTWLERIAFAFAVDSRIGGLGGRDIIYRDGQPVTGAHRRVGMISWYGRMSGNHHLGVGRARRVAVLKGVNMCWRRAAIAGLRFDARLRGSGAQVHCELAFSLAVARRGWWLVYDPELVVDHYHAPRLDEDQRHRFNALAFFNACHNMRLIMYEAMPAWRRACYLVYALGVGGRDDPGLVRALKLAVDGDGWTRAMHKLALAGRAAIAARRTARAAMH